MIPRLMALLLMFELILTPVWARGELYLDAATLRPAGLEESPKAYEQFLDQLLDRQAGLEAHNARWEPINPRGIQDRQFRRGLIRLRKWLDPQYDWFRWLVYGAHDVMIVRESPEVMTQILAKIMHRQGADDSGWQLTLQSRLEELDDLGETPGRDLLIKIRSILGEVPSGAAEVQSAGLETPDIPLYVLDDVVSDAVGVGTAVDRLKGWCRDPVGRSPEVFALELAQLRNRQDEHHLYWRRAVQLRLEQLAKVLHDFSPGLYANSFGDDAMPSLKKLLKKTGQALAAPSLPHSWAGGTIP